MGSLYASIMAYEYPLLGFRPMPKDISSLETAFRDKLQFLNDHLIKVFFKSCKMSNKSIGNLSDRWKHDNSRRFSGDFAHNAGNYQRHVRKVSCTFKVAWENALSSRVGRSCCSIRTTKETISRKTRFSASEILRSAFMLNKCELGWTVNVDCCKWRWVTVPFGVTGTVSFGSSETVDLGKFLSCKFIT